MDKKIFFKPPENLKMEIEKLISFEEKNNLLKLKKELEGKDSGKPLAKYSRVLTCSYAKSSNPSEISRGASFENTRTPHVMGDGTSIQ
jgi:hypothetical protein